MLISTSLWGVFRPFQAGRQAERQPRPAPRSIPPKTRSLQPAPASPARPPPQTRSPVAGGCGALLRPRGRPGPRRQECRRSLRIPPGRRPASSSPAQPAKRRQRRSPSQGLAGPGCGQRSRPGRPASRPPAPPARGSPAGCSAGGGKGPAACRLPTRPPRSRKQADPAPPAPAMAAASHSPASSSLLHGGRLSGGGGGGAVRGWLALLLALPLLWQRGRGPGAPPATSR